METWRDLCAGRGPAAALAGLGVVWGGFAGVVPALKAQVGLSDAGFGLALLVAASGAVLAIWAAPVAEARLGRPALAVAAGAMAVAFAMPGLAASGTAFALAMLAAAMASGVLDVLANARIAALEAARKRPFMNLAHGLFSLFYAFGALVAGILREAGATPFQALALLCVLTLGLVTVVAGAPATGPEARRDAGATQVPAWAALLPAGVILLVSYLSEQAVETWSALHLERSLDAGAAAAALGPAALGLTMAAGRFGGQSVAHRVSEPVLLRGAAVLAALGAVVAAHATALWGAYLGFAAMGAGLSVLAPSALAYLGRTTPAPQRAAAIARVSAMGYCGYFVGPPVLGLLAQGFGLPVAFTLAGALLLAIPVALVPWMLRRADAA